MGMNNNRADWAEAHVVSFSKVTGADYSADDSAALRDLLCDLLHLVDRRGEDVIKTLEGAISVYLAEVKDEDEMLEEPSVTISIVNPQSWNE